MKQLWTIILISACLTGALWAEDDSESAPQAPTKEAPTKPSKKPLKESNSLPLPEKKSLPLSDINAQIISLNGKVVETEITHANDITQLSTELYRVWAYFYTPSVNNVNSSYIEFPPEGKEFFEKLSRKDILNSGREKIYLLIRNKKVTAVGTRYNKSKNEYSW
jgi:hypothetical protein